MVMTPWGDVLRKPTATVDNGGALPVESDAVRQHRHQFRTRAADLAGMPCSALLQALGRIIQLTKIQEKGKGQQALIVVERVRTRCYLEAVRESVVVGAGIGRISPPRGFLGITHS
jgi:hypothetical protein